MKDIYFDKFLYWVYLNIIVVLKIEKERNKLFMYMYIEK